MLFAGFFEAEKQKPTIRTSNVTELKQTHQRHT